MLAVVAATSSGPRVHVEVDRGPKAVVLVPRQSTLREVRGLQRVDPHEGVCTSPCDAVVDAGDAFVAGDGVLPSTPFGLPPAGEVTVRVRAGRRGAFLGGWVVLGVGGPSMIGGAVAMTLADDDPGRLRTGAVVAGAGAALVLTGAILIATGRTRVRVE